MSITTALSCSCRSSGEICSWGLPPKHAHRSSSGRSFPMRALLQRFGGEERNGLSSPAVNEARRSLPSVDEVLARPTVREAAARLGRPAAKAGVRAAIAEARERLQNGARPDGESVPDARVLALIDEQAAPRLRRVLNATGVGLHTNLGRAPLHPDAVARVPEIASGYSHLELA